MWQAVAGGAGNMGGFMDMAMLPWKIGGNNAKAAEALYSQSMEKWAATENAKAAVVSEERQIANFKAQRILSDANIESNQRQAEAAAIVQAAAAGVEGGAVEQVINTTEINEANRKGDLATQTEGAISQSLENIYGYHRDLHMAVMPEFKSNAQAQMTNAVFGMAPGGYGLMTGQGPSGMFGLFGTNDKKRVDKGGSMGNVFLS